VEAPRAPQRCGKVCPAGEKLPLAPRPGERKPRPAAGGRRSSEGVGAHLQSDAAYAFDAFLRSISADTWPIIPGQVLRCESKSGSTSMNLLVPA